jgi:hypothetical protein
VVLEGDFLRFGRNTTGAAGDDCSGVTDGDFGCSAGGAGRAVTESCGSRPLFTRPRPKASLNIAPYQSTTASAACIHGCGARSATFIGAMMR